MSKIRTIIVFAMLMFFSAGLSAQKTYCNPLNLDYGYCPIPNFTESGKHRVTADPVKANEWKEALDSFAIGGWDPVFFTDDDGKLYMYNGSSNAYPLYGIEINWKTCISQQ